MLSCFLHGFLQKLSEIHGYHNNQWKINRERIDQILLIEKKK